MIYQVRFRKNYISLRYRSGNYIILHCIPHPLSSILGIMLQKSICNIKEKSESDTMIQYISKETGNTKVCFQLGNFGVLVFSNKNSKTCVTPQTQIYIYILRLMKD